MNDAPAMYPWPIVLYFHHVGKPLQHYTSLPVSAFTDAVGLLRRNCEIASPAELTSTRADPSPTRARVIITFDDGYAETIERAVPVLDAEGIKAAFFVSTATVGRVARHPSLNVPMPRAGWGELKDLFSSGHVVASHAHRHESLRDATEDRVREELTASRELIARHLGSAPGCAAYPYGEWPKRMPPGTTRLFSTIKAPAASWECQPYRIRRIFLDSRRSADWQDEIETWTRQWRASRCAECGHPHAR